MFLPPKRDSFRFTVDLRQVNKCIVPRAWPLPFLEIDLERAVSAGAYAVLDADNGYFQIENDPDGAEIFSILTEDGIFTPTRLVQGGTDGVAVFQSAMMTVLTDQIHRTVAIWIDDVVVFKANAELLAKELRVIFKLFRKFGVKLNPDKTTLYGEEIRFCGKIISPNGIRPNPEFTQGLTNMSLPRNVRELQQFVSAANWIRDYIIDYSRVFQRLQELLNRNTREAGTNKRQEIEQDHNFFGCGRYCFF